MTAQVSQAGYDFVNNTLIGYQQAIVTLNAQIAGIQAQVDQYENMVTDAQAVLADLEVVVPQ